MDVELLFDKITIFVCLSVKTLIKVWAGAVAQVVRVLVTPEFKPLPLPAKKFYPILGDHKGKH